ncbi:hypothetical protein [Azohydromonas australica]|uniref:hypothetical protein n=1 Tax=Azohydromonas australica TaxID=364039 RepID=UPI0012EBCA41|nr:hypothetical protein [Azohydromonas australica]
MDDNIVPINQDAQNPPEAAATISPQPVPELSPDDVLIADSEFILALKRLKSLCAFLLQVPVVLNPTVQQAARLGGLNQLRHAFQHKGRQPRYSEWHEVEKRTQIIWAALSEPQRRKFLATQTPSWISYLISAFIAVAAASLVTAYLIKSQFISFPLGDILIPFLLWIIALGAIGAAASIGMNALSVQDDATFDISSGKFIWLRLVLGALFGTVLTLPLGFSTFDQFLIDLGKNDKTVDTAEVAKQASLLLLPFILGFSTSLVILVLNRFIESVQTFFGKSSGERRANQN